MVVLEASILTLELTEEDLDLVVDMTMFLVDVEASVLLATSHGHSHHNFKQ